MLLDSENQAIGIRKDLNLRNFKVEMDIAGEVMSGLGFRVADEQNYEFIYFRPGYGGTQEAIQYIPIYNGALSWVFYNYPTYETEADIKALEWFHARIEVRGGRLKVFVNNSPTPQMDVTLLNGELKSGNLLLRSMFGKSYFANISIEELPREREQPVPDRKNDGFLRNWEISEQLQSSQERGIAYYAREIGGIKSWQKIEDLKDDYVNFCKYFDYPQGILLARHVIESAEEKEEILEFDFTGKLIVLLNGELVFHYEKYRLDRVFDGTFKTGLNLKKGKNELVFVQEGDAFIFGKGFNAMGRFQHQNWGFIAKLSSR